jgi:hypothetical protein
MNIKIIRTAKKNDYTIGHLYINGDYLCDTLEDKDRGLKQTNSFAFIKAKKTFGQTAIPTGIYKVTITYSHKFKKYLPLINDVKGFTGVRIHSGNTANDTEGCILVGRNEYKAMVTHSKETLQELMDIIKGSEDITLLVE